jgi:outer membrane protein OmpA-like peptidoglycan-associated protein
MPEINPNNYNIDNLDSQILGPISVLNFRNYILNHNLQEVNPEVQSAGFTDNEIGIYAPLLFNPNSSVQDLPNLSDVAFIASPTNNNTTPRPFNLSKNLWTNNDPFYGQSTQQETFEVTTKALEDPGNLDLWIEGNGFEVEVGTIRDMINLSQNEWGPTTLFDYSNPDNFLSATGYKQYPTSAGGGDPLGPIIARTLGFSINSFIDFPSELQDISKDRRKEELKNRIALNFVSDTVGNINLNPLSLIGGQSIITPNYTITRPKNFIGKIAEFTANLAGFNVPVSIIPGKPSTKIGSNAFQEDLLEYTGKGQRDLLYLNVYSSKYSPDRLSKGFEPSEAGSSSLLNRIGDFFQDLGKEDTDNYLSITKTTAQEEQSLAQKIGGFINNLITPDSDKSLIPTPEKDTNPTDPFVTMGVEGQYPSIESFDQNSLFNNEELNNPSYFIGGANNPDYFPNKTTLRPSLSDNDDANSSFAHQTPSANRLFDWRNRDESIATRGVMKFTQDMINNAESNGHRGGAKYIGRFNSNSNIVQAQKDIGDGNVRNVPKHKDVSMGNLVRSNEDTYYCRSWSTRNPYQNHYDLIRADKLYRGGLDTANGPFNGPYLSVLEESGHVKIAPYSSDPQAQGSFGNGIRGVFNANTEVKRYMFSIENLAWADAAEKIGLPDCEIGPNGGRIMWFPPYDINFTENITTNWETTSFIGRGEPIYSYNNTERTGTLSWKIITDHPSVLNQMKNDAEETVYKFFAGCGTDVLKYFKDELQTLEQETIVNEEVYTTYKIKEKQEVEPGTKEQPKPEPQPVEPPFLSLDFYFRNARRSDPGSGPRTGDGRDITKELDVNYELTNQWRADVLGENGQKTQTVLKLNEDFVTKLDQLVEFLATEEGQKWGARFIGYTSASANDVYNRVLSRDRAYSVFKYVTDQIRTKGLEGPVTILNTGTTSADTSATTVNYVYDERNYKSAYFAWVCKDNPELCLNEKESIGPLSVNGKTIKVFTYKQELKYVPPIVDDLPLSMQCRWSIEAMGQGFANQETDYGDVIADEDAYFNTGTENSATAKKDRKVTIKLFKNENYILDQTIPILPTKKAETLSTSVTSDGLIPLIDEQPVVTPTNKDDSEPRVNYGPITEEEYNTQKQKANQEAIDFLSDPLLTPPDITIEEEIIDIEPEGLEEVTGVRTREETVDRLVSKTVKKLYRECDYFDKIKKDDPFVYETINQKIKYFQPAFHSITPEGFNSRLTFLQQCTRQGPSLMGADNKTQNMAFGRPPICVLRIGDFYHTKIVIDSLSISYEPLLWDLNPEGIGVQPQLATIDLNFKFIGGSSLDGPIRQLQNAVSFNYYANTSVYEPRRYYDTNKEFSDGGFYYETLEEKLSKLAEGAKVETSDSIIGFGAFQTQGAADSERIRSTATPQTDETEVKTDNDNQNQTDNIATSEASGEKLPAPTTEDLENNKVVNENSIKQEFPEANVAKTLDPIVGYDNTNAQYTIQFNQELVNVKAFQSPEILTVSGIKNDPNTKTITYITGDFIKINKVTEKGTTKNYGGQPDGTFNGIYTKCDKSNFELAESNLQQGDYKVYKNDTLLSVIKKIYCNGNKLKPFSELIEPDADPNKDKKVTGEPIKYLDDKGRYILKADLVANFSLLVPSFISPTLICPCCSNNYGNLKNLSTCGVKPVVKIDTAKIRKDGILWPEYSDNTLRFNIYLDDKTYKSGYIACSDSDSLFVNGIKLSKDGKQYTADKVVYRTKDFLDSNSFVKRMNKLFCRNSALKPFDELKKI